jgi:hypothetical protein
LCEEGKRSSWKSLDDEQNVALALATEVEGVAAVSANDGGSFDFGRMGLARPKTIAQFLPALVPFINSRKSV